MIETSGELTIASPAALLVLVLLPLVSAVGIATSGARRALADRIALAGAAGAVGWACVLAARLARLPRGHVLGEHVGVLVRVGQLDLALDLVLDPLAALVAIVVALVTLAAVLHRIWSAEGRGVPAALGVLSSGALLVIVGDGIAPVTIGLGLSSLAAIALARERRPEALGAAIAADAGIVLALFFLFWSLGGTFGAGSGYEAESAARYAFVAAPEAAPGDASTVEMTTHVGARVTIEDGPGRADEPIRAPFSVALPPGVYTFRVRPGAGSGDFVVPHVVVARGAKYTLAPTGPTASFRVLRDQLALRRGLLATRTILGVHASIVIALLLSAALCLRLAAFGARAAPARIELSIETAVPAMIALRLAPAFDHDAADGSSFALVAVATAVLLAGRAAGAREPAAATHAAIAASAALVIAAAGIGETPGGAAMLVAVALAGGAALSVVDAERDVRWLGVACAALVGLIPLAGVSPGAVTLVAHALASRGGPILTTGAVATIVLASSALFHVYDAIVAASGTRRGSRGQGAVAAALAAAALASGVVLGAGTAPFGGRVVPLVDRVLGGRPSGLSPGDAWTALALAVAAAAAGAFIARRASPGRAPLGFAALPARVAVYAARGVGAGGAFLARGALALDRDVVVGAARGASALGRVGLAAAARADAFVETRTSASLARAADAVVVRLGLDHPRVAAKSRAAALLVLVALLAAIVLSSVLLAR